MIESVRFFMVFSSVFFGAFAPKKAKSTLEIAFKGDFQKNRGATLLRAVAPLRDTDISPAL
jgi:hypothetical protein